MNKRPTQKDVALKAGVSRPTVSLALQGSTVVSEETRKHIRKIAEELGYTPDPMLSALSKYRNTDVQKSYQGTLAWVSHSEADVPWNSITPYHQYYLGAVDQAKRLGYNIEAIDVQQQELSSERLDGILNARGIKGLLVCPPVKSNQQFNLPWDDYSIITFGYAISSQNLHRVCASYYRATKNIYNTLRDYGYTRIGFAFNQEVSLKTQEHCLAAYLCESQKHQASDLPVLVQQPITPEQFKEWYTTYKPDAVIICSPLWATIQKTDIRIPEDLGVACPMVSKYAPELTGIKEKCREIGAAAVDNVVQMIQQGKVGLPKDPKYILLEGRWNNGQTIKMKA